MTTPQQYRAEQQAAVAAAVGAAVTAAGMAGLALANYTMWLQFLRLVFPAVLRARTRAARSARRFVDSERERVTGLPQLDVELVGYDFTHFVAAMRPAYQMVVRQAAVVRELEKQGLPAPPPKIMSTVQVTVAKEVANAGREQVRRAVEVDANRATAIAELKELLAAEERKAAVKAAEERFAELDDDVDIEALIAGIDAKKRDRKPSDTPQEAVAEAAPNLQDTKRELRKIRRETWGGNTVEEWVPVKDLDTTAPNVVGWARVATGRETCAWCMMLVSRGPVYASAGAAGADVTSAEGVEAWDAGVRILMRKDGYHIGCDCEVVPVYDDNDWPGRKQAKAALDAYKKAMRQAKRDYDPTKKYRQRQKDGTYRLVELPRREAIAHDMLAILQQRLEKAAT